MSAASRISGWEWAAAAVSGALVASVIGALVIDARTDKTPPALAVSVEAIAPGGDGYVVRVSVRNDGGTTAAQVIVRGELLRPGDTPEVSEVTFDYVPDGSKREGGLLFRTNPAANALTVRALAYREP